MFSFRKSGTLSPDRIIKAVEEESKKEEKILKVFLFGSYAEGKAKGNSDIDIHVIHDGTMNEKELAEYSSRLQARLGKPIDAIKSSSKSKRSGFIESIKSSEKPIYSKDAKRVS